MQTKLVLKQPTTLKLRFQPGATGPAGQIVSVEATTLAPGSDATVVNNGTQEAAELVFGIPEGDQGIQGDAATIAVGDVTTGAAGSSASVTNVGTSGAAVFDFTIPKGDKGDPGTAQIVNGDKGDITTSDDGDTWRLNTGAVDNAKLANMATARIKGRSTAGSGDPEDLTGTEVTALLDAFTGDSGSGGVKGLVPAPPAGSAATRYFLNASGAFTSQVLPPALNAVIEGGVDNTGATVVAADLQDAIDNAAAAGRALFLPAGTYDVGDGTLTLPDNFTLSGAGDGTILQRSVDVGASGYDSARPTVIYADSKTGVVVRDMLIEYTAGTSTVPATDTFKFSGVVIESCTRCSVEGVRVTGRFYSGIAMAFSTSWTLNGCRVQGVVNRGFYINGSASNFLVHDCHVDGYEAGGATRFTQYGINMLPAGSDYVIGGRLVSCTVANTTHQGIELGGLTNDVWAFGCKVDNIGAHGFLIQTANSNIPQHNGLVGCVARGCQSNGFYILNAYYTVVDSCNGRSNVAANFEFNGAQYSTFNNLIAIGSTTGYGVWMKSCARNLISNSKMISNAYGLIEDASSSKNIVMGNHFTANTTTNNSNLGTGTVAPLNSNLST